MPAASPPPYRSLWHAVLPPPRQVCRQILRPPGAPCSKNCSCTRLITRRQVASDPSALASSTPRSNSDWPLQH